MNPRPDYKIAIGLILILQLSVNLACAQSQFRFRHYGTKDGLASRISRSIVQDSLGYIWVSHLGGLSRFDGYTFTVYRDDENDSINSPRLSTLGKMIIDPTGNMWLLPHTQSRGVLLLAMHDRKTDRFIRHSIDVGGAFANLIRFETTGPKLWLGTAGKGIFRYNFKTRELTQYFKSHPDSTTQARQNRVRGIIDLGTQLLVSTLDGLWTFDKERKSFSRPTCSAQDSILLFQTPTGS